MEKRLIFDLSYSELEKFLNTWQEPPYRAEQIWHGLYAARWTSFKDFSNLPIILRTKLEEYFNTTSFLSSKLVLSEDKNTSKALFTLLDNHSIETVLMRYKHRQTVCISTQVGCPLNCRFCATGQMGYTRNLSPGEIIEQVVYFARQLDDEDEKLTNIVFMGMGEPFLNYTATLAAIDQLKDPRGFGFGERRFTISTVGIIPAINEFTGLKSQINLAVSLHAATDKLRSKIIPINKKYPINELILACKKYVEITGRRITFEWALIDGFNDTPDHALELANLLKGINCHVNIILLNPTQDLASKPPTRQKVNAFKYFLETHKISCTLRLRRGLDIHAGCGQLAANDRQIFTTPTTDH